jgi:hypothetical protein
MIPRICGPEIKPFEPKSAAEEGQTVEALERNLAVPCFALDIDDSVQRNKRHAEIGRVGHDAALAPTEHRVQSGVAPSRLAACSREQRLGQFPSGKLRAVGKSTPEIWNVVLAA